MPDIRRPEFLKNSPDQAEERKPDASRLRPVAWAAAPNEPSRVLPTPPPARVGPPPAPRPMPAPVATAGANADAGFDELPPLPLPTAPMGSVVPAKPELTPKVEAAIQALRAQGERLAEQARADSFEIGLLVARKIVERELTTSLEPLFSLIRSAVRRVGDANKTVIKLSPGDVARLHDAPGADLTLGRVEVVADPSLGVGDVVVETEHHTVDGRLATRFDEIRRELLGTLEP